jgi:phage terminase large subunit
VEINFSSHPVKVLEELGYENIYRRTTIRAPIDSGLDLVPVNGFVTTYTNRALMVSNLVALMRESIELETDRATLLELTTFIRYPDGKPRACQGSHDDLVMASAIAHHVREHYTQNIQTIDTGSGILEKCFTPRQPVANQFMEW